MTSGRCRSVEELPAAAREILVEARRAVLTTIGRAGRIHSVPITWAQVGGEILTAIDQKPKSPSRPARLRNIEADPRVAVLFDRWDEDWSRLGWVLVRGSARIEPPGTAADELAARYRQYVQDPPAGEVIAVAPEEVTWWVAR